MASTSERLTRGAGAWGLRVVGYLLLGVLLTWPLALHLNSSLPGFPNVDAADTLWLRGLVPPLLASPGQWPSTDAVFWPQGYPVLLLTPNLMDHALGGMLAALLPFPLSDNVFWLGCLLANGLSAHHLGRTLTRSRAPLEREGAGWLLGVGWVCSEPLLRELNLHHAPQTMAFWIPLYLAAFAQALEPQGRVRHAIAAGLFMLGAALSYWYLALFAALGSLPLLLAGARKLDRQAWLRFGLAVGVTLLGALPALLPFALSWDSLPVTSPESAPMPLDIAADLSALPAHQRFEAAHGAAPLELLWSSYMDRSNRISWVLLGAVALSAALSLRAQRARQMLPWLAMAALGAVMVLGPFLKRGEDLVLVGGSALSLPFHWLGQLHPFLDRLTWPERWGMVLPLGLLAAAALRLPRPGLWVPALLAEALLLSANLPVQTQDLQYEQAWRVLEASQGAVLELPLKRDGLSMPQVGRHQRYHRKPVVNPLLLPPGAPKPQGWDDWMRAQPLLDWIRVLEGGQDPGPLPPGAVEALAAQGVGAIALDALPGSVMHRNRANRRVNALEAALGAGEDHGSVVIWWLRPPAPHVTPNLDGPAWRKATEHRLETTPRPPLDTLIDPTWNFLLGREKD
ncbi:MAG: hypothetical protein VX899_01055 [Myxococcota bacterium]|nr:hypothetical protein [Myxococcota bacterium]